jgi:hypothetical protein
MDKKKIIMVIPPNGELYGFPKPFNLNSALNFDTWLSEQGYPLSEIEKHRDYLPCQVWEEEVKEKCRGGRWRHQCDLWSCLQGCFYEQETS